MGFGKRTLLTEYTKKGRATGGIVTIHQKHLEKTGKIAVARVVQDEDEITLISTGGLILRLKVKDIHPSSRTTRGSHLIDLLKDDTVASLARISAADVQKGADEKNNGKEQAEITN